MVVSAEAFFTLTDLAGLTPEEAIASAKRAAATITTRRLRRSPRLSRTRAADYESVTGSVPGGVNPMICP